eukprot:364802-Chlamydomonas_euryale.AAC.3
MWSLGCTSMPSVAGAPFTVTHPASIHASASRRLHTPSSARRLFSRMPPPLPPPATSSRPGVEGLSGRQRNKRCEGRAATAQAPRGHCACLQHQTSPASMDNGTTSTQH